MTAATKPKFSKEPIGLTDAMILLNCSQLSIKKYIKEGMPCIAEGGRGKPFKFNEELIWNWHQANKDTQPTENIDEARLRHETAKASLAELELALKKQELIKFDDIIKEIEKEYNIVRAAFLNLPNAWAQRLADESDPHQVEKYLFDAVNEILQSLQYDKPKSNTKTQSNKKGDVKSKT